MLVQKRAINHRVQSFARTRRYYSSGFTIVELLIVIVVIAILATLAIVSYNGITARAKEVSLKSDLRNSASMLGHINVDTGSYPVTGGALKASTGNSLDYGQTYTGYCLIATNSSLPGVSFYITETGTIQSGVCIKTGSSMQSVTAANCPEGRTRVVDARDGHTYWIQKFSYGKCWMLTNLGYAGGGTNTYGDVKTLANGTSGSPTFTTPSYYIVPSTANFTIEPANPDASTTGAGQYGYFYNWCGAMGGQATAGCANATTPVTNSSISVCPAGWRLPTGNTGGEFSALNTAINNNSTTTDAGLLTNWLAQRGGFWNSSFLGQGTGGYYWTSDQFDSVANTAHRLYFTASSSSPGDMYIKSYGYAVRCVAN